MNLILRDGFDSYNGTGTGTGMQSKWLIDGTTSGTLVTGRYGVGQALSVTGVAGTTRLWGRMFDSAQSTFTFGFGLKITTANQYSLGMTICSIVSGATYMVALRLSSTNQLQVCRMTSATSATVLATGATPMPVGTNVWIDGEVTISDTVGVFNAYVDGDSTTYGVLASSLDTRNGTPTTCDTLYVGAAIAAAGTGTNGVVVFDDVVASDSATKIGPRRISLISATSDVLQGFTRSTGAANYSLINETSPDGDTSYVEGTLAALDRYGFGAFGLNPSVIDCVQISAFATNTDAFARLVALQVKSGATVSDGSNFTLPSAGSYGKLERVLSTDPNTGSAWIAANVPPQAGPKVTQ